MLQPLSVDKMETVLNNGHYRELVKIVLAKRAGWIYRGLLDAAREKKLIKWPDANALVDLERFGMIELTRNEKTYTIHITDKGKEAVRTMPADLNERWFPLPFEIAQAKQKLG